MEVVSEDEIESTPPKQKDWSEVLREEIAKADKAAIKIRTQVLQPHFTIEKMTHLMLISYGEAQKLINDIARFGYVETKTINGLKNFAIVSDPLKRIEQIKGAIQQTKVNTEMLITQYTAMIEITQNYIPTPENKDV